MIRITGHETVDEVIAIRKRAREHESAILGKGALIEFLQRFENGEITVSDLARIAEELEATDEVDYEQDYERVIASTLFEVASSEINGVITRERCRELIALLAAD